MNSCIIAINSGHERVMGYATCHRNGYLSLKSSNQPVIKENTLLVGASGSERMLTGLYLSPLMLSLDNSPQQSMEVIRNYFDRSYDKRDEALVLTLNNFMYHWHDGRVDLYGEFDESYLAIGPGNEVAMGAIYGLRSSRYTVHEQVEMALKAVINFYPELGKSHAVFSL